MIKITPLGDLHNGKQTELIQTEDETYIKKPRDFKTEVAFSSFSQRLEALGLPLFARSVTLISQENDFHTEKVERNQITTEIGIDTYYRNVGALLCICYLLGSVDLHAENIIASGNMPVIIDMETLLSGKKRRSSKQYSLSDSVLCSHLLCNFAVTTDGARDVSGLSGAINGSHNIPRTESGCVFPWEKSEIILSAFEETYRFLSANKEEVCEALHLFDDCSFRQLLRPTRTYNIISEKLSSLSEERKRSAAYELLSIAYKRDVDPERESKASLIIEEEVRSVLAGEIPLFYTKGNETDLSVSAKKVFCDFLLASPVNFAIQRLENFSETDLDRQQKIISLAIQATRPLDYKGDRFFISSNAMAPGEICAKQVTESAVFDLPSVFCSLEQRKNSIAFVSAGFSLYSGLGGIMCMYAALFRKTSRSEYYSLLQSCFENFSNIMLQNNELLILTDNNCGLADGIIGMLSALLHVYELTEITEYRKGALQLLSRLTILQHSYNTDYLSGVSSMPVILKRHHIPKADEICHNLYESLINAKPFTTGVAHGAAGLALSLGALSSIGVPVPVSAILDLLSWEEMHYSSERNNWKDLRDTPNIGFMSGWCSGAPGIGMARRELCEYISDERLRLLCQKDVERSTEFILRQIPPKRDGLCCGTASRLMAASRLGIQVDELYHYLSTREKENRLQYHHPVNTADINVSLMQGLSGVAYALAMYGDPLSGGMLL